MAAFASIGAITSHSFCCSLQENINNYLSACRGLGFQKTVLFDTPDLFEGKGMLQVLNNINALLPIAERATKRVTSSTSSSNLATSSTLTPSGSSTSISKPSTQPTPNSIPVIKSNSFTTPHNATATSSLATSPPTTSQQPSSTHTRLASSTSSHVRAPSNTAVDVPLAQAAPVNTRELLIAQRRVAKQVVQPSWSNCCNRWIERCLDIACPADTSFAMWLKSGVVLCKYVLGFGLRNFN